MGPGTVGRVSSLLAVALALLPASRAHAAAQSRTIYLLRDGIELRPGSDDSRAKTSSLITHPVAIPRWDVDDDVWLDTVECVREVYAPFAVTITDEDPGDVPHITAVFGGSPVQLGLSRGLAGVSPFTRDCGVVEHSIVFAFTEILPPDARSVCNVITQEIAHSYGLDHELLDSDPMTVSHTNAQRAFADQDVACGESSPRACGYAGSTCRATQNSYALLADRLGLAGVDSPAADTDAGGCSTTPASSGGTVALLLAACARRRRRSTRSI